MPPFIVVVVYNYRIAYFVEVFLYQLAQQVNFTEEDGNILMSVKAGDGLFQSTKYTDCDEVQELFE